MATDNPSRTMFSWKENGGGAGRGLNAKQGERESEGIYLLYSTNKGGEHLYILEVGESAKTSPDGQIIQDDWW